MLENWIAKRFWNIGLNLIYIYVRVTGDQHIKTDISID